MHKQDSFSNDYPTLSRCKFFNSPRASGRIVSLLSWTYVNKANSTPVMNLTVMHRSNFCT